MARPRGRKLEVDTTKATRDLARLAAGLKAGGMVVSGQQAQRTAAKIHGLVPVRTGRLASTVAPTTVPGGAGVTYGRSDMRYGYVLNARRRIVRRGMRGCRVEFYRALQALTAAEVSRV